MSEVLELLGMACLVFFAYLMFPPSALVVGGAFLFIIGLALDGVRWPRLRRRK